jgi:hypothetical protein
MFPFISPEREDSFLIILWLFNFIKAPIEKQEEINIRIFLPLSQ